MSLVTFACLITIFSFRLAKIIFQNIFLGWRHTLRIVAALMMIVCLCTILFKPIAPTLLRKTKLNVYASGNFFTTYNNRMYPTLSEVTEVPTVTLLQPRKLTKSSEVMIMSYPSSSMKCKFKDVGKKHITRFFDDICFYCRTKRLQKNLNKKPQNTQERKRGKNHLNLQKQNHDKNNLNF